MVSTHIPKSTIRNPQSSHVLRCALLTMLFLLSALAMYSLSLRLMGQIHHHIAEEFLRTGYPGLALGQLKKAVEIIPGDPKIHSNLGEIYFQLAALRQNAKEAYGDAHKSRDAYAKASALSPLDAQAAYGIARAETRLRKLQPYLQSESKDVTYDPDLHFQEAIRLRPNGILYRYAHARYLARNGRLDELNSAVRKLARIYPPSYHYLRKEPFWSVPVKNACREGLERAVKGNTSTRAAYMALSSMTARDGQWAAAIDQYNAALNYKAFDNKATNYAHLGGLYLKNGQFGEARACFFQALGMSRNRDRLMVQLYHLYRQQKQSERFEAFYREADRTLILPAGTEIILARTLMDLKQYNQARRILGKMVQKRPDAQGYYWLARIDQADKDWDGMELNIQKATVLEPENSTYHLLFSQALKRKKKLERAETEAALARKYKKKK